MLENIIKESKKDLQKIFNTVEDVEEYNSRKVLDAFIENKIIFVWKYKEKRRSVSYYSLLGIW